MNEVKSRLSQGWGGSEIHDLSSLQILPNLGTGTELSSNFSETSLTGTELKELKFQQILGGQGTEELGSLTFQRNFPVPANKQHRSLRGRLFNMLRKNHRSSESDDGGGVENLDDDEERDGFTNLDWQPRKKQIVRE